MRIPSFPYTAHITWLIFAALNTQAIPVDTSMLFLLIFLGFSSWTHLSLLRSPFCCLLLRTSVTGFTSGYAAPTAYMGWRVTI